MPSRDRKSTRLNSSHLGISYAVFCLKKKKKKKEGVCINFAACQYQAEGACDRPEPRLVGAPATARMFAASIPKTDVFPFFFNDTATTEIYTLSLHDALPIYHRSRVDQHPALGDQWHLHRDGDGPRGVDGVLRRTDVPGAWPRAKRYPTAVHHGSRGDARRVPVRCTAGLGHRDTARAATLVL